MYTIDRGYSDIGYSETCLKWHFLNLKCSTDVTPLLKKKVGKVVLNSMKKMFKKPQFLRIIITKTYNIDVFFLWPNEDEKYLSFHFTNYSP